jgi:hypothetical protein
MPGPLLLPCRRGLLFPLLPFGGVLLGPLAHCFSPVPPQSVHLISVVTVLPLTDSHTISVPVPVQVQHFDAGSPFGLRLLGILPARPGAEDAGRAARAPAPAVAHRAFLVFRYRVCPRNHDDPSLASCYLVTIIAARPIRCQPGRDSFRLFPKAASWGPTR